MVDSMEPMVCSVGCKLSGMMNSFLNPPSFTYDSYEPHFGSCSELIEYVDFQMFHFHNSYDFFIFLLNSGTYC